MKSITPEVTNRGFVVLRFTDINGEACSLQESSRASQRCVWLGLDNVKPKSMIPFGQPGAHPWQEYPLPEHVEIFSRMELTQSTVRDLLPYLTYFAGEGELPRTEAACYLAESEPAGMAEANAYIAALEKEVCALNTVLENSRRSLQAKGPALKKAREATRLAQEAHRNPLIVVGPELRKGFYDSVLQFVRECCVLENVHMADVSKTPAIDVYDAYKAFAVSNGLPFASLREFYFCMKLRGFSVEKGQQTVFVGLTLKSEVPNE